ncbi:spermidine synthase [Micrococcus lylae]|uniref:spermidine synthase n=1 Tax=Micrococcus lylae TaxID=1273 RepID=UPI000C80AD09|nr:fused MFS/spermidine synthase [Micrococcus lylae]WIK81703.1 fused MFS/spermidine synthase [Micrococcus lylae]
MAPSSSPSAPPPGSSAPRSVHLGVSGELARILSDEHGSGHVLQIGGHIQSHVDLARPGHIRYEYLRRMANVLDVLAPPGEPIDILHLGAGALTLPRYVQTTRPGSAQTVVDIDRELVSFVTAELPLPEGTALTSLVADARDAALSLAGRSFDAVVLDIDAGADTAPHRAGRGFYTDLLGLLSPAGVLLVNIGDETGLHLLADQARELEAACLDARLTGVWTLADATMLERLSYGNAVLAAGGLLGGRLSPDGRTWEGAVVESRELTGRLTAAGPHPAAVLDPAGTAGLVRRIGLA